jgi:GNAT superfamily N-acetyltransferase
METFRKLDQRARQSTGTLLEPLTRAEQDKLVRCMKTIEALLGDPDGHRRHWVLRPHQPGDLGWAVHRHGLVMAREHDWDTEYEARVAGQAAEFLKKGPGRDRCWVAELDGETTGIVVLLEKDRSVAELDLLLLVPPARDFGIGSRLVAQCIESGRKAGFAKITARVSTVLEAARHVLKKAGFRVVRRENQQCFGHYLLFETWELKL